VNDDHRRSLPSVDALLRDPAIMAFMKLAPRNAVVGAAREAIQRARTRRAGPPEDWALEVMELLAQRTAPSLGPVINATGIILHTNLGRAPLAEAAVRAVEAVARGYSTLEYDLHAGVRGSRADHCRYQLAELTGADDALVVNNAAGALVLALNALAEGKEVIISRGELIEIGGSFRIPDILEKSGARLREVGTTNRTHLDDYRQALGPNTGAILTVHRSNFEQTGFVATPEPKAVAALAQEAGVPYLHDVGSGLLVDLSPWGLAGEPRVPEAVKDGADLVVFSGDKLLGGPQAGCIVGRGDLVARCRTSPFARALRADKMTLAAMEATLALYRDAEEARREIPVLAMLTEPAESIRSRAGRMASSIGSHWHPALAEGESVVGGGSFPGTSLPTTLITLGTEHGSPHELALHLRLGNPSVVARVTGETVALDVRTMRREDIVLPPIAPETR
jgi:L-seryl-tRNA(Ser) seleniumtransferase